MSKSTSRGSIGKYVKNTQAYNNRLLRFTDACQFLLPAPD
jgi:hypothetical protein